MSSHSPQNRKPDLDTPEHIAAFVEAFYECLLNDDRLAPIFTDVANIDIREHFPRIRAYWEKLLLGKNDYHRHTMNIHRELNAKQALLADDFTQWLGYFVYVADRDFSDPKTERAKQIATTISQNMRKVIDLT